jgi:fucose 4-O-acetylase-like acetyltransferase
MSVVVLPKILGIPTIDLPALDHPVIRRDPVRTSPAIPPGPPAPSTTRNEAIDAFRLFAAGGIVFVHAVESPYFDTRGNFFRFAVPFFLFASLYFQSLSLRRRSDRTLGQVLGARLTRLYVPFLLWSTIYLVARDFERVLFLHLPPVKPRLTMLVTGTEYHLWFLPFLLFWTIALVIVQRCLIQRSARARWIVIGISLAAACAIASRPMPPMPPATQMNFDYPFVTALQWLQSIPCALAAIAFACFMALGPTIYTVPAALGITGLVAAFGCSLWQAMHSIQMAPRAISGLGTFLLTLVPWKTRAIPAMARIGRRGYGIYLCHVIPVEMIHLICHKAHLENCPSLDIANWALSFLGAWGLVVLFEKSRLLAWLNG